MNTKLLREYVLRLLDLTLKPNPNAVVEYRRKCTLTRHSTSTSSSPLHLQIFRTAIATEIYEMEHFKIPFWNALERNRAQFVCAFFFCSFTKKYKKTQEWRVRVASFWKGDAVVCFVSQLQAIIYQFAYFGVDKRAASAKKKPCDGPTEHRRSTHIWIVVYCHHFTWNLFSIHPHTWIVK